MIKRSMRYNETKEKRRGTKAVYNLGPEVHESHDPRTENSRGREKAANAI
jgi:hypothetical protein